jgi:hypothetical protein
MNEWIKNYYWWMNELNKYISNSRGTSEWINLLIATNWIIQWLSYIPLLVLSYLLLISNQQDEEINNNKVNISPSVSSKVQIWK